MQIIVVSDNHGDKAILDQLQRCYPNADLFLHLGDSELSEWELGKFISVKGNKDHDINLPKFRYVHTEYGEIYMEHGIHLFGINEKMIRSKNALIFLSGHTHVSKTKKIDDKCYYANPGSLTRPRDGTNGTYIVINLTKDNVDIKIIEL